MSDVPLLTFAEVMARPCACGAAAGEACNASGGFPFSMDYPGSDAPVHVARLARFGNAERPCRAGGCPNTGLREWNDYCRFHVEHYRQNAYLARLVGDGRAPSISPGPIVPALRRRDPAEVVAYFDGALAALRKVRARSTCGELNIEIDGLIANYEMTAPDCVARISPLAYGRLVEAVRRVASAQIATGAAVWMMALVAARADGAEIVRCHKAAMGLAVNLDHMPPERLIAEYGHLLPREPR